MNNTTRRHPRSHPKPAFVPPKAIHDLPRLPIAPGARSTAPYRRLALPAGLILVLVLGPLTLQFPARN